MVRWSVLAAAGFVAAAAGGALAVQRRLINPFGRPARLVRGLTNPLLRPMERRLIRSGGNPQNAPYWIMGVAILGGIVVIELASWLIAMAASAGWAARGGPRALFAFVAYWAITLLMLALFVRVIGSWLSASPYNPWMRPFHRLTEWMLRPLRRVIPAFGPLDVTPLVAWFLLMMLRGALT